MFLGKIFYVYNYACSEKVIFLSDTVQLSHHTKKCFQKKGLHGELIFFRLLQLQSIFS